MTEQETKACAWIIGGDTGISSKAIWGVMMTGTAPRPYPPLDPADFGRCHRLLLLFPEWQARLSEVSDKYPAWRGLVGAWDELGALYQAEIQNGAASYSPASKLYARMKELSSR